MIYKGRPQPRFIFIPLPIHHASLFFLFLHCSITHPCPTPPPSLQNLHAAILSLSAHHASRWGPDCCCCCCCCWWWLMGHMAGRSFPHTEQCLEALRSPHSLHGDLMLMATLETAGGALVRWMARGWSWRRVRDNQACNTRLRRALEGWYANVISASIPTATVITYSWEFLWGFLISENVV